jgi:hypothetical protein
MFADPNASAQGSAELDAIVEVTPVLSQIL